MMADDAAPLVEAVLTIIGASRAYQPGEIDKDGFITKVLEATDNPKIIAAGGAWTCGGLRRVGEQPPVRP
jgi:hypothetical protein